MTPLMNERGPTQKKSKSTRVRARSKELTKILRSTTCTCCKASVTQRVESPPHVSHMRQPYARVAVGRVWRVGVHALQRQRRSARTRTDRQNAE